MPWWRITTEFSKCYTPDHHTDHHISPHQACTRNIPQESSKFFIHVVRSYLLLDSCGMLHVVGGHTHKVATTVNRRVLVSLYVMQHATCNNMQHVTCNGRPNMQTCNMQEFAWWFILAVSLQCHEAKTILKMSHEKIEVLNYDTRVYSERVFRLDGTPGV